MLYIALLIEQCRLCGSLQSTNRSLAERDRQPTWMAEIVGQERRPQQLARLPSCTPASWIGSPRAAEPNLASGFLHEREFKQCVRNPR